MARALATLSVCGGVFLVLLLYAPQLHAPFLVPKFAALEVCAALGWIAFAMRHASGDRVRWDRTIVVGWFLVFGTTAIAWLATRATPEGAPYAVASLSRWGSLLGLTCAASVVSETPGDGQRVLETIAVTSGIVAVIGLMQHAWILPFEIPVISVPGSTFGNRNAAAEVMALALPLSLAAAVGGDRGTRRVMLAACVLELLYLAITRTRGAWIAAAIGLIAMFSMMRTLKPRRLVAAFVVTVACLGVAVALPARRNPRDVGDAKRYSTIGGMLQDSFDAGSSATKARLGLWRRTLAMVREHPLFGVGPGNWPVQFPRYAEPGATHDTVMSAIVAPRQAHQDFLERTAETGIAGGLALGVLAIGAAISVRRRLRFEDDEKRITTAAPASALIAFGVLGLSSFPLEEPATLMLAGVGLGMITGSAKTTPVAQRPFAGAGVVVGLLLLCATLVRAERSVRASRWLSVAERAFLRDANGAIESESFFAIERAIDAEPTDFRAHLRGAQILLRMGRAPEAVRFAQKALRIEPHVPNAWATLAAAELARGNTKDALTHATHALTLLRDYPYALKVRSTAAERAGDPERAKTDREALRVLAAGAESDPTARDARALLAAE